MSSPPATPRLSATHSLQRVPTQTLEEYSAQSEAQKMSLVTGGEPRVEWENKLFACCSPNPGLCLYAYFCPCIIYGRVRHRLQHPQDIYLKEYNGCNSGCWGLYCGSLIAFPMPIIMLGDQMKKLRQRYNIEGSSDKDFLKALCWTCAIVQAEKEIVGREKRAETAQYGEGREKMDMAPTKSDHVEEKGRT